PAVMHRLEQMRRGVRRTAPVVRHSAVRKVVIDLARVDGAALEYELEEELRPLPACRRPGPTTLGGNAGVGARMHQRLDGPCHEAVGDEEVLLEVEHRVAA